MAESEIKQVPVNPQPGILREILNFRMARQLFMVVIVAIVIIEAIIIFPSYANFENSRIAGLQKIAGVAVMANLSNQEFTGEALKHRLDRIMRADPLMLGVAALNPDGDIIASVGDGIKTANTSDSRYLIRIAGKDIGISQDIIVRMDALAIAGELNAFLLRISGLVLIICLVSGSIVFFFVAYHYMRPLNEIQDSLRQANKSSPKPEAIDTNHGKADELTEIKNLLGITLQDIDSSHRSDIKHQEQRLHDFAAAGSDWFWEMDDQLRFTYFSDQFERVTGVSPGHLLGKTREEAGILNIPVETWQKHLTNLRERKPFRDFEHPRTKPDGSVVWLSISGKPAFDSDGNFLGFRGTGSDITKLYNMRQDLIKAKELAEQGDRMKSEFLATMSHEIRTPMAGVIGMIDVLVDTSLDEEQKEYVQVIRDSGKTLLTILNDILDYSKLEANRTNFDSNEIEIEDLVGGVMGIFIPAAAEKNLELTHRIENNEDFLVSGDYRRLHQVLANLISNSIKFTMEGSISVIISLKALDHESACLRAEVEDTGIGIAAGDHDKLFESFAQVDSSTSRRFGGIGLGLAISRRIIEIMAGTIGVESEEGKGSRFWFEVTLPLVKD